MKEAVKTTKGKLKDRQAPPKPWTRTTKARPCPVCHRAGCLLSAPTDPAAVVCATTESAEPIGTWGFLHILRTDGPAWSKWRLTLARLAKGTP